MVARPLNVSGWPTCDDRIVFVAQRDVGGADGQRRGAERVAEHHARTRSPPMLVWTIWRSV